MIDKNYGLLIYGTCKISLEMRSYFKNFRLYKKNSRINQILESLQMVEIS